MPRNKNIWIHTGWRKTPERETFGDNAKYFFLYIQQHKPNIRSIWIAQDKKMRDLLRAHGYSSYTLDSFMGTYLSLRAGVTIVDSNLRVANWRLSGRSIYIQLWHGKSFKKMGKISPYGSTYNKFLSPNLFVTYAYIVAASHLLGKYLLQGFEHKKKHLLISSLPRYDVFFNDIPGSDIDEDTQLSQKIDQDKKAGYESVAFYAPTYRPDGSNPLEHLDLTMLSDALSVSNTKCYISLHPKCYNKDWKKPDGYQHIEFIQTVLDIYPIFKKFSVIITDYSSMAIDALLCNVPSVIYAYDESTYRVSMGIHDELWDAFPAHKTHTMPELCKILKEKNYAWNTSFQQTKEKFFTFSSLHGYNEQASSKRVYEAIEKIL